MRSIHDIPDDPLDVALAPASRSASARVPASAKVGGLRAVLLALTLILAAVVLGPRLAAARRAAVEEDLRTRLERVLAAGDPGDLDAGVETPARGVTIRVSPGINGPGTYALIAEDARSRVRCIATELTALHASLSGQAVDSVVCTGF